MADLFDKAQAIWKALDEMAAKNPEAYKKFIHDQLHGDDAQEISKRLGMGVRSSAGDTKNSKKSSSNNPLPACVETKSESRDLKAPSSSNNIALSSLNHLVESQEDEEEALQELKIPNTAATSVWKPKGKKLIEEL